MALLAKGNIMIDPSATSVIPLVDYASSPLGSIEVVGERIII